MANYIFIRPNEAPAKDFQRDELPKFTRNNITANFNVPQGWTCPQFQLMVSYLRHSPISAALQLYPRAIYPAMLCEFWYTADMDSPDMITGWVIRGQRRAFLSTSIIRRELQLPEHAQYEDFADRETVRSVLPLLGRQRTTGTIKRNEFGPMWGIMISTIIRCMTHKTGALDQINDFGMQLVHAMYHNRHIDYARLIFNELVSLIQARQRNPNVPFCRFLSIIFQNSMPDAMYNNFDGIRADLPPIHEKIFFHQPREDEPPMSATMLAIAEAHLNENEAAVSTEDEDDDDDDDVAMEDVPPSPPVQEPEPDVPNPASASDTEEHPLIQRRRLRRRLSPVIMAALSSDSVLHPTLTPSLEDQHQIASNAELPEPAQDPIAQPILEPHVPLDVEIAYEQQQTLEAAAQPTEQPNQEGARGSNQHTNDPTPISVEERRESDKASGMNF